MSIVIPPPPMDLETLKPTELVIRAMTNPPLDATYPSHAWWRRAEIPAANGHGNARSVALVQSVVAGRGEARGVRLLSEAGLRPDLRRADPRHRPHPRVPSTGSAWATGSARA